MFKKATGFMDSAQIEKDTAALQNYIQQMKNLEGDAARAAQKQDLINETLKDSSKIAQDVARNTNNLDDVMNVYTASTRTATSVAKAFKTTLLGIGKAAVIALAVGAVITGASELLQLADEKWVHPYEHARDKAAEMSQAHEESTQKVEELTKQVEELKAKMDECRSTTTGDIVDQKSYDALDQQRKQLQTNLDLAKQLNEETAYNARNAVYDQQDANQSVTFTSSQYFYAGTYGGNQSERLKKMMDDYISTFEEEEQLEQDFANNKILKIGYDTRKKDLEAWREFLRTNIKAIGDDYTTEMDTLLNNAPNEFASDDDKSKYQERIKNLSDNQQAFLNFWNLYINNIPLITQATNDFTQSVANGDDSVKALNDAINGGQAIKEGSDAYKEAADLADKYGVSVEGLIAELKSQNQAGVEAHSVIIDADTAVKKVTTTISAVTAALQAQTTGVGVTAENFKALTDADKDYADCLEYVNGTMQINTKKAKELTDKKIEEAKATVRVARSQAQLKYAENKQELSRLNEALKKNNNLSEEQQSTLKEAISNREQENKKLREQCQNYELLYSQLVQASGAYQDWLNAQNATEAGTMYDDAIKDALESGKIGTQKYKAAVEFLVPKSVDENAVQQYVDILKKYLTDDSNGITNFLNDAVKAGLMEEDSSGYVAIAGKKTIQDFCDAMKLTPEMVRAIFGELQEYGFDWEWDDAFFGETLTSLEMQADELQEKMDSVKPDSDSYEEWNNQLKEVNEKIENIKGNIDSTDVDALVDAYEKAKDAVDQMNSQGSTFDGQADELQSALDKAADNLNKNGRVQLWIDASEAEKTVDDLTQRFNSGDFSVATELEAAQDELADLNTQKEKLGAPTEVEIQVYAQGLEDAGKTTEEITQTLKDAKILNVETDDSEDKLSQTKDTVTDIANILLTPYTLDLDTTEAMTKLGNVKELMNQISETTITAPVPSVPKSYAERITTGTTGTGSANAAGTNGGLARAERALVGELGYEVVVNPHSGKWYTVGEHGAEFVNLPKDAIVFDHQKSEELLKNGFVGARGMAMAEGNAYPGGSDTVRGGGNKPENNPITSTTFQKNAKAAAATATATEAAQKNLERIEAEADAVKEAYEAQKKALEKQKKELESIKDSLESEQKTLDGIVKTITARIDKEIDRLEHQWDDLKEQLEDEKNNLDAAMNGATYLIEKRTKALQKEQEALEDSYQPRIDALQDELDKLNETNDAQEKAIELARKKAAMDAAKANRSVRVYREGKGFVWEADESEVKSTEEDYNDALRQKEQEDAQKALEDQKAALEKELEDKKQELQDKIDAYDEYKDKLSEGQNEYTNSKNVAILRQLYGADADQMILNMDQAMIDKITTDYMNNMSNTDHVENQIKENQKLIDQLEDYKNKWEEVADAYEAEQNRINTVARLGADWEEKILGQRTDVLDDFKNHYIDILRQIEEKTAEINDLSLKIEVVEEEYQTKSDELDKEKKAAQAEVKTTKSSSTSSHATGIMNVAAFERARVDEAGPEIVVRQPEAGRYTSLEIGDGVVPGNLTRRLFSAAINPEAFVESAILKRMGNVNAELASAVSSGVHIGDINIVMNGVNDVENFGRILHQNIGSIMAQEFSKR